MIEYKGFNIPETSEETIHCRPVTWFPFRVTLYNADKSDAITTQVQIEELEDAFALQDTKTIDQILNDFRHAIDEHVAGV